MRITLAQLAFRPEPSAGISAIIAAMEEAAQHGAHLICTAENYTPGMRCVGLDVAPPDPNLGAVAERAIRDAALRTGVGAIIGIERPTQAGILVSTMIIGRDGALLGYQDKVQIDPAEEGTYITGANRRIFEIDDLKFGVVICHEGWRYPETVRACARQGAHIVFHPHISFADTRPRDPAYANATGTMHEKAAICRAAENTIFFASVNYAIPNPTAGSAVIDPSGRVIAVDTTGFERLLTAEIDPSLATGLLAQRLKATAG